MLGVLQRKVKTSQSDCSLQARLVMCEIKLKEPTDGSSHRKEVKQRSNAAEKDLQHDSSVPLGDKQNLTGPVEHQKRAAAFGEARHSHSQSCGNHKVDPRCAGP